jgi:hypothetical protein
MPNRIRPIRNASPPSTESVPGMPAPSTASTSAGGPGDLDEDDRGDERRAYHAQHHSEASRETAPLGLSGVKPHEGEDEGHVGDEQQACSEHRAVVRIAAQVEDMADHQHDAGRDACQPTSPNRTRSDDYIRRASSLDCFAYQK